jgi:hypothetical protein
MADRESGHGDCVIFRQYTSDFNDAAIKAAITSSGLEK